ncbi:hypothetical protein ACRAWD_05845 [Caulobacter segnis]
MLGRETALQKLVWGDGRPAPHLDGSGDPTLETRAQPAGPALAARSDPRGLRRPRAADRLPAWLRTPYPDEIFSLAARPGSLRLFGRESLGSVFRQALVARRQQDHCYSAATVLDFEPEHFQQAAGLVCYYNGVPSSTICTSPTTRRSASICG